MNSLRNLKRKRDAYCKKILSYREITSRVLKVAVEEYSKYSIDVIQSLLDEVSFNELVDAHSRMIHSLNSEDKDPLEGEVKFDLLFRAKQNKFDHDYSYLMNIEAQNKKNPGYPLVIRAIYYLSRMISMQKNKYFKNSEYYKILKCYSIWIIFESPDEYSHINILKSNCKSLSGRPILKKKTYDKQQAVMIYIGENNQDHIELIDILKLLFLSNKDYNEVIKELKEKYNINLTEEFREDYKNMCNLSDRIEQQGIQIGIKKGKIESAIKLVEKNPDLFTIEQALALFEITKKDYQAYQKNSMN